MKPVRHILPVIIIAQFCCTSLWFAGNAVTNELIIDFGLADSVLGHITSSVQLGFIAGTLVFAVLSITDRFSPSKVFFGCAIIGALFNVLIVWDGHTLISLLGLRFLTGFCLAGIYPVGMKIAADYFDKGLGKSLGYLVGALVLGTALPHLLKVLAVGFAWQTVFVLTSSLAALGGILILILVPDGPYRKKSSANDFLACFKVFRLATFRQAAIGYFGHMWELYAFWAFVPVMLATFQTINPAMDFNIPLLSFFVIGVGSIACAWGGKLSERYGVKRTATLALSLSFACCLLSPIMILYASSTVFMLYLLFWGMVVIADSPLFSTLVAQNADAEVRGAALTIVNSIGFAITIVSIQLLTFLPRFLDPSMIYLCLAIGPAMGLIALVKNRDEGKI
jgi:MFS family permease